MSDFIGREEFNDWICENYDVPAMGFSMLAGILEYAGRLDWEGQQELFECVFPEIAEEEKEIVQSVRFRDPQMDHETTVQGATSNEMGGASKRSRGR